MLLQGRRPLGERRTKRKLGGSHVMVTTGAGAIKKTPYGAEAIEGVLLLGRMPQGNTAIGGTSQGESYKRIITGESPQNGSKKNIIIKGTLYEAYIIKKILLLKRRL